MILIIIGVKRTGNNQLVSVLPMPHTDSLPQFGASYFLSNCVRYVRSADLTGIRLEPRFDYPFSCSTILSKLTISVCEIMSCLVV